MPPSISLPLLTLPIPMVAFARKLRNRRPADRAAARVSPLDVPEILERIFGHLASSQIRYASRVCKLWHSVSLRFNIDPSAIWHFDMSPSNTIGLALFEQSLMTATRLSVSFQKESTVEESDITKALTTTIQNLPTETQSRIRVLHYSDRGSDRQSFDHNMFRSLRNITTLHVETDVHYYHDLDQFFTTFPNLEVLFLGLHSYGAYIGRPELTKSDPDKPWPASVAKLQSLTLHSVLLDPSLLDDLLNNCLMLKELKLMAMYQHLPVLPKPLSYYHQRISAIAERCPDLESFHFSEYYFPSGTYALRSTLLYFPGLTSWSALVEALPLDTHSVYEILGPSVEGFINQLTTLELLAAQTPQRFAVEKLLCMAPNLLHLKTKGVLIDASHMSHSSPNLWVCRRLQTLHIGIIPHLQDTDCGRRRSRSFFAYLVKCCPCLKDIYIHESDLSLALEGGFCVLSELNDLRRLDICAPDEPIRERDLDWMSTLNQYKQPVQRLRRWWNFKNLKTSGMDMYHDLEQLRRSKELIRGNPCQTETELRLVILEASTLDYVISVVKGIWDRQSRGVYCWPHLEVLHVRELIKVHRASSLRPALLYQEETDLHRRDGSVAFANLRYASCTDRTWV